MTPEELKAAYRKATIEEIQAAMGSLVCAALTAQKMGYHCANDVTAKQDGSNPNAYVLVVTGEIDPPTLAYLKKMKKEIAHMVCPNGMCGNHKVRQETWVKTPDLGEGRN